jgi:oligopeptide/dipeptide ABC transporter ATP-binding protein
MNEGKRLLSVKDLTVDLMTSQGIVYAVNGVSFEVQHGEIYGIIGESGCGKTITVKAIMRLLDKKRSRITGSVKLGERELLDISNSEMRRLRGSKVSIIFQEPMTFLSPLEKIGNQIGEILKNHHSEPDSSRREKVFTLLEQVKLHPAEQRSREYPFELSGGQQQRVMIASAVACRPELLIADEPTTALDVTIQAQILELLKDLRNKTGMAMILITHNFGVVAEICDKVSVMYAGKIVETADVKSLLSSPAHPYTRHLLDCVPRGRAGEYRLRTIGGSPPRLRERTAGCPFASRCFLADMKCTVFPETDEISAGHTVSCYHARTEISRDRGGL